MLILHKCRKHSVSRRLPLLFLLHQAYCLPILESHLPFNPGFALTPPSQGDLISTKQGLPDLPLQADFPQPSLVRGPSDISPWLSIPQPSSTLPSIPLLLQSRFLFPSTAHFRLLHPPHPIQPCFISCSWVLVFPQAGLMSPSGLF